MKSIFRVTLYSLTNHFLKTFKAVLCKIYHPLVYWCTVFRGHSFQHYSGRPHDVQQLWSFYGRISYLSIQITILRETSSGQIIVPQSTWTTKLNYLHPKKNSKKQKKNIILEFLCRASFLQVKNWQRNWVFATNSNCLILISWKPNGGNPWYFKVRLFDLTEFIVWNI